MLAYAATTPGYGNQAFNGPQRGALCVAALVEAGLVIRNGLDHYILPDAVEVADQLSKERGGLLRWVYLEERIRDERARPRGDEVAAALAADDDRRRREEHDELMRQVGML